MVLPNSRGIIAQIRLEAELSNRDSEVRYERPEQAIPFAIQQMIRGLVHTGMPGIVRAYDPRTKRARVQPAIRTRLRATEKDEARLVDKQPILNVPLRQPATGDHMVHHQVDEGDVVWLFFSERGLAQFKAQWGEISDPTVGCYFAMGDAVAVPWGVEDIMPVRTTGWLVQSRSGESYISLDGDTVRLVTGGSSIVMTPDTITVRAPTVNFQANRINDSAY